MVHGVHRVHDAPKPGEHLALPLRHPRIRVEEKLLLTALEAQAYGIPLGTVGERLTRFEEAAEVIVSLLSQESTTFHGRYFGLPAAEREARADRLLDVDSGRRRGHRGVRPGLERPLRGGSRRGSRSPRPRGTGAPG